MIEPRPPSRLSILGRSGLLILLSVTLLFSATGSPTWDVSLWRNTLLLSIVSIAWWWFRKRQAPRLLSILYTILCIIASTTITQHALVAAHALPVLTPINTLPDLSSLYLVFHYALVVWLILRDLLPSAFHLPAIWPALFLYSSYLYFRTFFALEQGTPYPILYALILGQVLLQSANRQIGKSASQQVSKSASQQSPFAIRHSLFAFLLLLAIATALSAAPGESLNQYFQIACFALLPFLLARDLADKRTWHLAAVWVVVLGGLVLVVLAGVKSGTLARDLGLIPALRYRLSIADIGSNWISRPLLTLLPLSIGFLLAAPSRWHKLLWGAGILGMLLTIAYTQSSRGFSGWMALILGGGTFALLLQWPAIKGWWRRHTRGRLVVIAVGTVLIVTMIVVGGWIATRTNSYSFYSRLYGWRTLFYQVADHPLFGSGLGIRHITAQYGNRVLWEDAVTPSGWLFHRPLTQHLQELQLGFHAHNLFLELAVGAGLPALGAFLWFLWALARHSLIALRHATGQSRVLIAGCIAGIVASLGWGLIDVMEYSPPFFTTPTWVLVGLLLAAPRALGDKETRRQEDKRTRRVASAPAFLRFLVLSALLCLLAFVAVVMPLFGNMHYRAAYTAYQEHRWAAADDEPARATRWEPLNAKYHQLRGEALINLGRYVEAISAYERALRLKRDFAPYHAQLGWLYWLQGDLEQATAHFQKAVEMDPREAWRDGLHADLGLVYVASQRIGESANEDLEKAIALFKETIELDPQMALAPYWVPVEGADGAFDVVLDPAYASRRVGESASQRGSGGNDDPLEARILAHLGKADYTPRLFTYSLLPTPYSLSLNQVLDAIEADYVAAHAAGSREAPRLLATVAEAARLVGLHDRAERAYLAFQEACPQSAYGFRDLGMLYREQGRLEEAQVMLERAVEISPRDTSSWFGLADVALDRASSFPLEGGPRGVSSSPLISGGIEGGPGQALDTIYRLAPLNARFYELWARLYREQGDLPQAADALRQSLFIRESISNRLALADLYRQLGRGGEGERGSRGAEERAIEQCVKAAEALLRTWPRPLDPELWEIGVCLAQSERIYEFTNGRMGECADGRICNVLLGHIYRARGQLEQALLAYQAAADARPDEGAPHYFLGETYQALGQPEVAEAEYRQAAQLDSLESLPLLALGRMQWQQGQQDAALESFRAAVEVTPGCGEAHTALANALLASGDRDGAAEHYQLAQMADGDVREGVLYDFAAHLADADIQSPGADYVRNDYFTINDDQRRVLFAHPDSRLSYRLSLPPSPLVSGGTEGGLTLAFDVATAPESWEQPFDRLRTSPGDGVTFAVYIESDQSTHQLFSTYIDPKQDESARCWHSHVVDLSGYAGQAVTLIFEIGTGPAGDYRYDWAGWGAPRVLGR